MNRDTLIVSLSDMHSGSSYALFPNRTVQFTDSQTNHTPTENQRKIYQHWQTCIKAIQAARKGKRLVIVHNGDATENIHHNITTVVSPAIKDHAEIHIELMNQLLKAAGFSKKNGDQLFYVEGTESHTLTLENYIAEELNAEVYVNMNGRDYYAHPELETSINGKKLWYTHHGAGAGDGANEGDGYRNWLKRIYWNCVKADKPLPDMIVSSHVHKPIYTSYVQDYHTIHGMVLPSWQMKTRYAYRVAPFQRNDIGLAMTEITAQGDIRVMKPLIMTM